VIESIGSSTSAGASQRAQATSSVSAARVNPTVLNAITQTQQKRSSAVNPVTALAVPQGAKSGNGAKVVVPRGSLLDVLA